MNQDASVGESQQGHVPPEIDPKEPKRKRHHDDVLRNLTPPSGAAGLSNHCSESAPKICCATIIPTTIAGTKMSASIRSAPRLARAGPGQNPLSPHPTPKIAAPITSRRSIGSDPVVGGFSLAPP